MGQPFDPWRMVRAEVAFSPGRNWMITRLPGHCDSFDRECETEAEARAQIELKVKHLEANGWRVTVKADGSLDPKPQGEQL